MTLRTLICAFMTLLSMCSAALADTVEMKDGRRISAKVLALDGKQLRFVVDGAADTTAVAVAEVAGVRFGGDSSSAAAASALVPNQASPLPAGSIVAIRTIDPVDSGTAKAGQSFRATVDEEVVVNGAVVVPRGADAVLKLVIAKSAGRLAGNAQLSIALESVKVGDRLLAVNSETVTSEGTGKGKSSAIKTGIGTGVGATLGSVFGGKRGAGIGAAAGAGAGVIAAMATKGPRVSIPSETRLSFTVQ